MFLCTWDISNSCLVSHAKYPAAFSEHALQMKSGLERCSKYYGRSFGLHLTGML